MSTIKQAVIILLMIAYLLFPIDLIPDMAIGPGQIDDIIVIITGIYKLFKSRKSVEENAEEQTKDNSVKSVDGDLADNQDNKSGDTQEDKIIDVTAYTIVDVEDDNI